MISEAAGKPVRYENLPEDDYVAVLVQAGLPAEYAKALGDADAGIARGILDVRSGDLEKLLGRPATGAVEVFRGALG